MIAVTRLKDQPPTGGAVFVALLETIGGLMLLVGVLSSLISIPLIVTMSVAYITSEKEAIASLFTKDYEDFFAAAPWLYLFACLRILLFGPGRFSIDALWRRRGTQRYQAEQVGLRSGGAADCKSIGAIVGKPGSGERTVMGT